MEKKSFMEVLQQLTEAVEYEGSQLSFLFVTNSANVSATQCRKIVITSYSHRPGTDDWPEVDVESES